MRQYQQTVIGLFSIDGMTIPNSEGNRHYRQMQEEVSKGEAEIIPFDFAAKSIVDALNDEKQWVSKELSRADTEFNKCLDSHSRKTGTQTIWKAYRNALRDHIINDVAMGERPIAPDA